MQVTEVGCVRGSTARHVPVGWTVERDYAVAMAEEREQAIEEILSSARSTRSPLPRWVWVLAGVVGVGCAIAFVVAMLTGGEASSSSTGSSGPPVSRGAGGMGFGAGLALGAGLGIAIGFAIARQGARRSEPQVSRDHSSRKSP
jgi:hypothetical protein